MLPYDSSMLALGAHRRLRTVVSFQMAINFPKQFGVFRTCLSVLYRQFCDHQLSAPAHVSYSRIPGGLAPAFHLLGFCYSYAPQAARHLVSRHPPLIRLRQKISTDRVSHLFAK